LCETNERFSDEYLRRLKEESERFWGKRLTMPAESPRWPPKHDVLNYRIGQRIRARRSWGFVFQADLARAIGISQAALSRMEKGVREIGVVELVRIAELLETTPESLLYPPPPEEDDY
jgi:transcriptional regulator with XRE-family HTH domain